MNRILTQLKEKWDLGDKYESSLQKQIWDRRAVDFDAHPLPNLDNDEFIKLMREEVVLIK